MSIQSKIWFNKKVPLNKAIISDILLWLALAALLAYGIYLFAIAIPARQGQVIKLSFRNANEISRGAPVRLMGTDVGFVDNIQIRQDHVEVVVQTYPDSMKIPSGAVFTVLFTGLGGAKSIEVDLPRKPFPKVDGKPVYRVKEPISMRDTLNSSLDSIEALQKGAENIADFFGKKKPVEELQFNIREAHEMSQVAVRHTGALNTNLAAFNHSISTYSEQGVETLSGFNHGAKIMVKAIDPTRIRRQLGDWLPKIQKFNTLTERDAELAQRITQSNDTLRRTSHTLARVNSKVSGYPLQQRLTLTEQRLDEANEALAKMDAFFAVDRLPALMAARQSIQNFNRRVLSWDEKVTRMQQQAVRRKKKHKNPVPATSPVPGESALPSSKVVALADKTGASLNLKQARWWHGATVAQVQDIEVSGEQSKEAGMNQSKRLFWFATFGTQARNVAMTIWDSLSYLISG